MKKVLICIIFTFIALATKTLRAQTFEELKKLSDESSSILQEAKVGQYGGITISQDEGSAGQWVEIYAPQFHFSTYKENVVGMQGSEVVSPIILVGKVDKNVYMLLIQTFTTGFIAGEESIYLIDSANKTSRQLFIPGYVIKIFEKEWMIFIDSQEGGYMNDIYTQLYSVISVKGETIISTTYQREVESEIAK